MYVSDRYQHCEQYQNQIMYNIVLVIVSIHVFLINSLRYNYMLFVWVFTCYAIKHTHYQIIYVGFSIHIHISLCIIYL